MRTYSHAMLTWAAARALRPYPWAVAGSTAGAVFPDLPAIAGVAWVGLVRRRLGRRALREDVCSRRVFAGPDAALHSALPVGVLLASSLALGPEKRPARGLLAFLAGWAGHVLADALTHARDARPVLWPVCGWRPRSPISYWEGSHHGRVFSAIEHAVSILLAARTISRWVRGASSPVRPDR